MLLQLDSVECLGHHVSSHVGSVKVLDVDQTIEHLLAGVVEANIKVLGVAGGDRVVGDVDGRLVVLEDGRDLGLDPELG